ncbi:DUF4129 domain-containing protein [Anaeromyxobacter oryzae]|uniref:DUF4129 domain-containing protein n=1 Tax=Anaeromyxobacter oryzae TaxID=2918170 RepID=A0ABM7WYJ9_9BACT|nr:DUF4129 domain-containing protein [Anaeromyxobacter oryzae]BDG04586.1 hypothetical protein AMOR_35820 [Anaeromyxobacter oryzae]
MPFLAGIVAALVAAAPGAPEPGRAADPAAVRDRAARILSSREYQRALPDAPPPPRLDLPLSGLAALLRVLGWAGLAVLLVLVGTWAARRLRRAPGDVEVREAAATAAPIAIPIGSAEALATAGRYGAAIHALLLDTLAALSRAARLAPSLTSREIVERVALPARARDALAGLVVAVEVSHFGGAEPGEADYRACLDRFHAFLETYRSAA